MNILVIGASKSGEAAAKLAKKLGNNVLVTEFKPQNEFDENLINKFQSFGINYEFGGHSLDNIANYDLIIVSPGVPRTAEILKIAQQNHIKIFSEIEFAYQHCNNPIIAITGTNGKTTTTSLIAHILNSSGKKAVVAGNIGIAFSDIVLDIEPQTIVVLEVSSYQLDRIEKFRPNVAIIMNITPDHLKYHGTMDDYVETKWKINSNQIEKDLLILNYDDSYLSNKNKINKSTHNVKYFSLTEPVMGAFVRQGMIVLKEQHKEEEIMPISQIGIKGQHNVYNSLAAILATRSFEITNENYRSALSSFAGVNHRLEFTRELKGIRFYNDSKATNVNSTWFALNSFDEPIIWIAGGRGDNNDYSLLDESVKKNVKAIVTIGEEADNIGRHFAEMKPIYNYETIEQAIFEAYNLAKEGEIVLFSPACKSFDMFTNFEHRGDVFKSIVNKLV